MLNGVHKIWMLFDDVVSETDISIPQEVGIDVGISRVGKDKALSASCLWVSEAERILPICPTSEIV